MFKILIKNTRIQKFLATLMICAILTPAILVSTTPRQAEAQWVVNDPPNTALSVKDLVNQAFKQAKMHVARRLTNVITQRTTAWIASGFHGNPFYLEKPQSFFKDIAKYEIRNFVDTYGYDNIRFPFGRDAALRTITAYQRQYENNNAYTLSRVINDPVFLQRYQTDFNFGGWDAFFINTQYPQNNYIGFSMRADEELARQLAGTVSTAAEKTRETLEQSGGFLAPQICDYNQGNNKYNNGKNEFLQPRFDEAGYRKTNPLNCGDAPVGTSSTSGEEDVIHIGGYNECVARWDTAYEAAKAEWAKDNACPGGLTTTTPGGVVANQLKKALDSKTEQTNLAAAMGNAVALGFGMLVDNLINKGLKSLSKFVEPTKGIDSVNLQPASTPGGGGVDVSVCQNVSAGTSSSSGRGQGFLTNSDNSRVPVEFDIDLDGSSAGGDACTTISVPGSPGVDYSEIGKWYVGDTGPTIPPGDGGSGCGKGCTCKTDNSQMTWIPGIGESKYRDAVLAAINVVRADTANCVKNGLNDQCGALDNKRALEMDGPGDDYVNAVACVLRSQGYTADGSGDELGVMHTSEPTRQENFDLYNSQYNLIDARFMAMCTGEGIDAASGKGRGFTCQ